VKTIVRQIYKLLIFNKNLQNFFLKYVINTWKIVNNDVGDFFSFISIYNLKYTE